MNTYFQQWHSRSEEVGAVRTLLSARGYFSWAAGEAEVDQRPGVWLRLILRYLASCLVAPFHDLFCEERSVHSVGLAAVNGEQHGFVDG